MWGAAIGFVAGGFGPTLAKNLFGLRPDSPEVPPLPEALPGEIRIDEDRSYGPHPRHRFDLIRPPEPVSGSNSDATSDATAEDWPGVVLFHGGGFARGSRRNVMNIARALAQRGFAVMSADYRLLPRTEMSDIVDDARMMTQHAYERASELGVDPSRLATMGRSAGGHLALMAAYTSTVPIRATISEAAPTDMDPVMWDGSVRGAMMQRFSRASDARALSPVHVASAAAPPTLLLHGCRDGNVPFAHGRILQVRLEGLQVPVQLVALPRTGHNPLWWRWHTTFPFVCAWLQHYTGATAKG